MNEVSPGRTRGVDWSAFRALFPTLERKAYLASGSYGLLGRPVEALWAASSRLATIGRPAVSAKYSRHGKNRIQVRLAGQPMEGRC